MSSASPWQRVPVTASAAKLKRVPVVREATWGGPPSGDMGGGRSGLRFVHNEGRHFPLRRVVGRIQDYTCLPRRHWDAEEPSAASQTSMTTMTTRREKPKVRAELLAKFRQLAIRATVSKATSKGYSKTVLQLRKAQRATKGYLNQEETGKA